MGYGIHVRENLGEKVGIVNKFTVYLYTPISSKPFHCGRVEMSAFWQ